VTQDTNTGRQMHIPGTDDSGHTPWKRLDIAAADFAERPTPPKQGDGRGGKPDLVVVPDTPYDPALWLGADDEGVGGARW
jgi:hypothetical protein